MKPVIGVLLDPGTWRGIPWKRTGHEKISYYDKAAKKLNVKLIYFPLSQVMPEYNRLRGYIWDHGKYRLVERSIPLVIHNRSMAANSMFKRKRQALTKRSFLYNERTRYSKYYIHRVLAKKASLHPHLPHTESFNKPKLDKMMRRFDSIYVKPVSSSIGRGIYRLAKTDQQLWMIQGSGKQKVKRSAKIYPYLKSKTQGKDYLLQETIPLAHYQGQPFDIRVSVQKSGNGEWQVTGMVGKVAAKGSHVTNVARGGKVRRCEELFEACGLNAEKTKREVEKVSIKIAKQLGKSLKNLADIGLDMGIDSQGKPYFIEMNGRDLRYSFRNGNLMTQWYKTYEHPIRYGKYLFKQARRKLTQNL